MKVIGSKNWKEYVQGINYLRKQNDKYSSEEISFRYLIKKYFRKVFGPSSAWTFTHHLCINSKKGDHLIGGLRGTQPTKLDNQSEKSDINRCWLLFANDHDGDPVVILNTNCITAPIDNNTFKTVTKNLL